MSDAVVRTPLAGGLDPSVRSRATPPASSVRIEGSAAGDRIYRGVTTALALCVPLLLLAIAIALGVAAWPAR